MSILATANDDDTGSAAPLVGYGLGQGLGGTLHQIDALNGLMHYGITIQFTDLSARKYLHWCKNTKNMLMNVGVSVFFCNFAQIFNSFSV